jgi:hypothetical protein
MDLSIQNEAVANALLARLDPFQLECLATLGHFNGISYNEITKLRPSLAKGTIENAISSGKLKRNPNGPTVSWSNLKSYLEKIGRL